MPEEPEDKDKQVSLGWGDKNFSLPLGPKIRTALGALLVVAIAGAIVFGSMWLLDVGPFSKGKIRIDRHLAEQMVLANRYVGQKPKEEAELKGDGGTWSTLRFRDDALLVRFDPNDQTEKSEHYWHVPSHQKVRDEIELDVSTLIASPAGAAGSDRCDYFFPSGEHPGPFDSKPEPLNDCESRLWRIWGDGCIYYLNCDCESGCDPTPNWTQCVH